MYLFQYKLTALKNTHETIPTLQYVTINVLKVWHVTSGTDDRVNGSHRAAVTEKRLTLFDLHHLGFDLDLTPADLLREVVVDHDVHLGRVLAGGEPVGLVVYHGVGLVLEHALGEPPGFEGGFPSGADDVTGQSVSRPARYDVGALIPDGQEHLQPTSWTSGWL